MTDYPFHVDGAGRPSMFSRSHRGVPVLVLVCDLTAHHGVTVGGPPCRLVADPALPLRLAAAGEVLGRRVGTDDDGTTRWVVLTGDRDDFIPVVRAMYGDRVRIEYATEAHD